MVAEISLVNALKAAKFPMQSAVFRSRSRASIHCVLPIPVGFASSSGLNVNAGGISGKSMETALNEVKNTKTEQANKENKNFNFMALPN
jgi:hypothetical protein